MRTYHWHEQKFSTIQHTHHRLEFHHYLPLFATVLFDFVSFLRVTKTWKLTFAFVYQEITIFDFLITSIAGLATNFCANLSLMPKIVRIFHWHETSVREGKGVWGRKIEFEKCRITKLQIRKRFAQRAAILSGGNETFHINLLELFRFCLKSAVFLPGNRENAKTAAVFVLEYLFRENIVGIRIDRQRRSSGHEWGCGHSYGIFQTFGLCSVCWIAGQRCSWYVSRTWTFNFLADYVLACSFRRMTSNRRSKPISVFILQEAQILADELKKFVFVWRQKYPHTTLEIVNVTNWVFSVASSR